MELTSLEIPSVVYKTKMNEMKIRKHETASTCPYKMYKIKSRTNMISNGTNLLQRIYGYVNAEIFIYLSIYVYGDLKVIELLL